MSEGTKRNISVVKDADGNKIVVINDIIFKGKKIAWDDVEKYLRKYVGEVYSIAEDKEKSRWLSSRTLTHKRPAAFQKTEADTASSKESQGQSSRKSRSAGNMSVFDLLDTEYHSYKSPTG